MRWILSLVWLALLLGGCATGLRPAPSGLVRLPTEPSFWTLALRRGNQPLYTGLLLLSREEGSGAMVLLDATGIKLLEARVDDAGELSGVKALRPVADRGLPGFLGRSLQRLFLIAPPPPGEVCRPEGWGELCQGFDEAGRLVRIRRWGPWKVWTAEYSITGDSPSGSLSRARLGQGWLTPEVVLERRLEPGE